MYRYQLNKNSIVYVDYIIYYNVYLNWRSWEIVVHRRDKVKMTLKQNNLFKCV